MPVSLTEIAMLCRRRSALTTIRQDRRLGQPGRAGNRRFVAASLRATE